MELFLAIFLFLVGLALIVKGGDAFVDASSAIAEASGIPKFIIGATIVSIATTLPELIVSLLAASKGSYEMAIGNAVGSVTANTGLIMALSLVCIPMMMKRKNFMFKGILLLFTMTLLLFLSIDGKLYWYEGIILIAIFGLFIWENVREAKKATQNDKLTSGEILSNGEEVETPEEEKKEKLTKKQWIINIVKFVLGAAGIVIGSQLLVNKGTFLATYIGIPEKVISLTAIAIGTSLPELVTCITSIIKKESSLSVGNVLGANIIDTTLILPLCAFISGGALPVSRGTVIYDIPAFLIIGLITLIPSFITQKFRRWQGIACMILYVAYILLTCFVF